MPLVNREAGMDQTAGLGLAQAGFPPPGLQRIGEGARAPRVIGPDEPGTGGFLGGGEVG